MRIELDVCSIPPGTVRTAARPAGEGRERNERLRGRFLLRSGGPGSRLTEEFEFAREGRPERGCRCPRRTEGAGALTRVADGPIPCGHRNFRGRFGAEGFAFDRTEPDVRRLDERGIFDRRRFENVGKWRQFLKVFFQDYLRERGAD